MEYGIQPLTHAGGKDNQAKLVASINLDPPLLRDRRVVL